ACPPPLRPRYRHRSSARCAGPCRGWRRPRRSSPSHRRSPGRRCAWTSGTPRGAAVRRTCCEGRRAPDAGGARRAVRSCPWPLLLLPFLAAHVLEVVLDALPLVGLGPPQGPDLGRHLPDPLLVGAGDLERGLLLADLDRDALGDREL